MAHSKQGPKDAKPLEQKLRDRAKDLIRDILEALDGMFAPVPQPVPIPVRGRARGRGRR
jgi:hypothetical protein